MMIPKIKHFLILLYAKIIFLSKKQPYVKGIGNLDLIFDLIDKKCRKENLSFYLNIGKSNLIDIQIVHPNLFKKTGKYGYGVFACFDGNDDIDILIKLKESRFFSLFENVGDDKFLILNVNRKETIDMLSDLLMEIWGYKIDEKIFYDINLVKERG